jgi:ATP-dependent Clp protease ATP-binding subunit ClpA
VLELAMTEARERHHNYVGTEHLLIGLIREEKGLGAQVLKTSRVTLENARAETLRILETELPPSALASLTREVPRSPALRRVTPRLRQVLNDACGYAPRINAETPVMIAVALLRHAEGAMRALLDHLRLDIPLLLETLEPVMAVEVAETQGADLTERAQRLRQLFLSANAEAERMQEGLCSSGHMLIALVATTPAVADAFREQGLGADDLRKELARLSG